MENKITFAEVYGKRGELQARLLFFLAFSGFFDTLGGMSQLNPQQLEAVRTIN